MDSNILRFLPSKSPAPAILISPRKPSTATAMPLLLSRPPRRCLRIISTNGTSNSSSRDTPGNDPPSPTPETVEIRFRRGSRKRRQQMKDGQAMKAQTSSPPAPKKWEDMSVAEKATELYVGEKGLLFWLNKFAYASIFIVIGGWILFRFVGPSLNLYQLDTPPLAPTSIFKG
ncbi:hypothetical protein HS088_TW14G00086 [Tripterygium wilfordii]|uniref:Uncharacterized protein n=2 Tax=Tripterygium wilfordii TaxID=458696 RepID=A0A7J7CPZ4_TRIWF|nr:hypothetical protein HS088_TW14G00086 [Tripterygium wilfordii]